MRAKETEINGTLNFIFYYILNYIFLNVKKYCGVSRVTINFRETIQWFSNTFAICEANLRMKRINISSLLSQFINFLLTYLALIYIRKVTDDNTVHWTRVLRKFV